jgi:hypothetical protein
VKIKYKFSVGETKEEKVCPYGIISFRIKYKIIVDIKANKNKYYLYQRLVTLFNLEGHFRN